MARPLTYLRIYCERQRAKEMAPLGPRGGRLKLETSTGKAYAQKVDGEWRCTVCGERVTVVT